MFGLGFGEIVIILVLALVLLGPQKLPEVAKQLGKGLRDFKKASDDLKGQFEQELYADERKAARARIAPPTAAAPVPAAAPQPVPPASVDNVPGLDAALAEPPPRRLRPRPRRRRSPRPIRQPGRSRPPSRRSPTRAPPCCHERARRDRRGRGDRPSSSGGRGPGHLLRPPEGAAHPAGPGAPRRGRRRGRGRLVLRAALPLRDAAGARLAPGGAAGPQLHELPRALPGLPQGRALRRPLPGRTLGALPALALHRPRPLQEGEEARHPVRRHRDAALLLRGGLHLLRGHALRLPGAGLHRRPGHEAHPHHARAAHAGARHDARLRAWSSRSRSSSPSWP